MKIFGRDPSIWIPLIGSALAFLVTLNIDGLTDLQAAAIMGVLTAAVGALNGFFVRPFNPAFANGLVAAVVGVLAAYGLNLNPESVTAFQAMLVAAGGLWAVRMQVTPKADPVPIAPSEGVIK